MYEVPTITAQTETVHNRGSAVVHEKPYKLWPKCGPVPGADHLLPDLNWDGLRFCMKHPQCDANLA